MTTVQSDFSQGSIPKIVTRLALPCIGAQLLNALYNVVDRMFIGRISGEGRLAITGVGLGFPIIMIISAFAGLFGTGGTPIFSIARGAGEKQKAEKVMGNSFFLLIVTGIVLPVLCLLFLKPMMYAFGASDATYKYAGPYMTIYLIGSIFVMISLGMNQYIQAQGFAKTGMMTVVIGAVINTVLDPIFIFIFKMGVLGAAIATVIAQLASAVWVVIFLTSKKVSIKLTIRSMKPEFAIIKDIVSLGISNFIMAFTNSAVSVVCNKVLYRYGGDLYVGIMTVISSVKNIVFMPVQGFQNAAQPVISFNYGAKKFSRVKESIKFLLLASVICCFIVWVFILVAPGIAIKVFNNDAELLTYGKPAMRVYFLLYVTFAMQMCGQAVFVGLGMSKHAVCFSLLRKVVLVIPLVYLLPHMFGLGVMGVFASEPISELLGGGTCFVVMLLTVLPKLKKEEQALS